MHPSPPSSVTLGASSQKRTSFFGQKEKVKCQGQCPVEDASSFSAVLPSSSSSSSALLNVLSPLLVLLRIFGLYHQTYSSSWKSTILSPGFLYSLLIAVILTLNFAFTALEVTLEKQWIDLKWFSSDASLFGHGKYYADLTIVLWRLQVVFNVWFCFFMCRKTYFPSLSLLYDKTYKDTASIRISRRWIYGQTAEAILAVMLLAILPFLLPCCDSRVSDLSKIFTGSSLAPSVRSQYTAEITSPGLESDSTFSYLTSSQPTPLTTDPPHPLPSSSLWSAFPFILFTVLDIFSAAVFILPLVLFKSFCILLICNFRNLQEQFQDVLQERTSTHTRSLSLPDDIPCDLNLRLSTTDDEAESDNETTWLQQDEKGSPSSSDAISMDKDTHGSLKTILNRHKDTSTFSIEVKRLFNSYINACFIISAWVLTLLVYSSSLSNINDATIVCAFFFCLVTLLVASAVLHYKAHAPCLDLCDYKKSDEESGDLSTYVQVSFFLHGLQLKPVGFTFLGMFHLTSRTTTLVCGALLIYLGHLTAQWLYNHGQ